MINKVVQWRLLQSDCINKGYILDNYPQTPEQAQAIFLEEVISKIVPEVPENLEEGDIADEAVHNESQESRKDTQPNQSTDRGESEVRHEVVYIPRERIMPQKVMNFTIDDETEIQNYVKIFFNSKKSMSRAATKEGNQDEIKEEGQEENPDEPVSSNIGIEESKYSIDNVAKRMEEYKLHNDSVKKEKTFLDFFKEYQIEVCRINPQEALKGTQQSSVANKSVMEYVCEKLDADFTWAEEQEEEHIDREVEGEVISGDKILPGDKRELNESEEVEGEQEELLTK